MATYRELSMEALNLVVGGTGEISIQDPNAFKPPFTVEDDEFNPEFGIPRGGRVTVRV